jgi:Undecaprenyl-phosphate galactose phosphotransferase WbaP
MTGALGKGLAFFMGFSFAFLPAYGPFVGLLFFVGTRWELRRSDLWWWSAALLFALPLSVHRGWEGFGLGLLQVLAPWLIYRAFEQLFHNRRLAVNLNVLSVGLLAGLTVVVAFGLLQIERFAFDTAKTVAQAIVWDGNAGLFGHTVLALGCLLAILLPSSRFRVLSLALAALGILVSGSREAAIAWVMVAVGLLLIRLRRSQRTHLIEIGLIAVMVALAAGLGPLFGWGRVGFLVDLLPASASHNLLQGSELMGDWWDPMGVTVQTGTVSLAGRTLTSYTVTKTEPESWRRLQQVVPIQSNTPYVVSVWLRVPQDPIQPGFLGWGQLLEQGESWALTGRFDAEQNTWHVSGSGPGRILEAGIAESEGDWRRVWASFVYEGTDARLYWWLGLAPDLRSSTGATASFAGFQLEEGEVPTTYAPGSASKGLGLRVARFPYWQAGWQGVSERPVWGWGPDVFPAYYRQHWPEGDRLNAIPAHLHNLVLHHLFERGVVGLLGLALLLIALTHVAWRRHDLPLLLVFGALLTANLFDATLLYGGVLYPLAAVAGWRAAAYRAEHHTPEDLSRRLVVGLALPLADYATTLLAAALAVVALQAGGPLEHNIAWQSLGYALLLWPLLYWREGIYPGYGLSSVQELKRYTTGSLYAGLLLAAVTLFLSNPAPIPPSALLLTVLFSLVLNPLGRVLIKQLLLLSGVYKVPVVILGAGSTGVHVAETLRSRPWYGLYPEAIFDEDPTKQGKRVAGIPVRGTTCDAFGYAAQNGIDRAIVTLNHLPPALLAHLSGGGGQGFKRVHYLPGVEGLPLEDVKATSLGDIMTLEVRNNLLSSTNQVAKRALDLTATIAGGLLISPLLLLLCLALYLDSPGPLFYAQCRVGRNGRRFKTWKFRTMVVDAETILQQYLDKHPALKAEWERSFKLKVDPRITRVGKFLRRSSLDELPQLFNVLKGEMSLVGPRPLPEYHHEALTPEARAIREMVQPGMTGLWQISSRSDGDLSDIERFDTYYVRNWSVWLDLDILMKTLAVVVRGKGAY